MQAPPRGASSGEYSAKHEKGSASATPPVSENVIIISETVAQRIQNGGAVDEARLESYDKDWVEKLASMDEAHSKQNKLDMADVEKMLHNIADYARPVGDTGCPGNQSNLAECYMDNLGQTLRCSTEVQDFVNCVDSLLYNATRVRLGIAKTNTKLTYAEKFKRGY